MQHKYGFHVNRTGDDVFDAIQRIKPAVIKTLDANVGFWMRVRAILPNVFLIGRQFVPLDEQSRFVDDPAGKGRALAERILRLEANKSAFQGRRLFDAWESYNEIMPESASPDEKRKYDDFQVAFAGPIKAAGFEPIGMNFATGNMLGPDFVNYFAGTLETYTYLGFHEYDWPTMWRLHEENIREKNEGGMWLTLRYRRTMGQVRQAYPNRHTVIITECGMTQGVQGGQDVGWLANPPVSEDSYWESLMWYNQQLMKDDYVAAALLYVVGAVAPWESFEHLGGIINRLAAFQGASTTQPIRDELVASKPKPSLAQALVAAADKAQVIQFNPDAALQKRIFADGFVPNSPEFDLQVDGVGYVGQRAEHLGTGEVRVYYVRVGDWANVAYQQRGEQGTPGLQYA